MKPHSFCETPNENCTLNYCDENGCLNRKRKLVDDDVYNATEKFRESYKIHGITEFEVSAFSIGYLQAKNKAKEDYEVVSSVREVHQYKLGLEDGYNKAKETFYNKQDLIDLVQGLKDYTKESHTILGHDDREPSEFVNIFLNEISDEELESLSLAKELNKQPMTFVSDEISDKKRNFVFSDDKDINNKNITKISDKVLFEQATVAMEEIYGYGCDSEIDAYFRGAKWMQKQFKK